MVEVIPMMAPIINYELETYDIAFRSNDRKEGMQAFLEKRKPEFRDE